MAILTGHTNRMARLTVAHLETLKGPAMVKSTECPTAMTMGCSTLMAPLTASTMARPTRTADSKVSHWGLKKASSMGHLREIRKATWMATNLGSHWEHLRVRLTGEMKVVQNWMVQSKGRRTAPVNATAPWRASWTPKESLTDSWTPKESSMGWRKGSWTATLTVHQTWRAQRWESSTGGCLEAPMGGQMTT